jgi:hypothetical protein
MGELDLVHVDSGYVGDVASGYRAAVLVAVLAGLPLAFIAAGVLLATWRRAPRPWPQAATAAFRVAFVIECASCLCSAAFVAVAIALAPSPGEFFAEPLILLMLVTFLASGAALPAWRTAMLATPEGPPSILARPRG